MPVPATGPEVSDYLTIYLPWDPEWTAQRSEKLMKKKDKILNRIEFSSDEQVIKCRRYYKIHVCEVALAKKKLARKRKYLENEDFDDAKDKDEDFDVTPVTV